MKGLRGASDVFGGGRWLWWYVGYASSCRMYARFYRIGAVPSLPLSDTVLQQCIVSGACVRNSCALLCFRRVCSLALGAMAVLWIQYAPAYSCSHFALRQVFCAYSLEGASPPFLPLFVTGWKHHAMCCRGNG